MAETTDIKKFLDYVGVSKLWTNITNTFAPKWLAYRPNTELIKSENDINITYKSAGTNTEGSGADILITLPSATPQYAGLFSADDKQKLNNLVNNLDSIKSSIKFKGTVSMDSASEMSAIFDSMSVGESCFLTPVTGVSGNATGYGSWVNTAFNDTVIQINDSLFKSDTSGLELTGGLTGKWNDNHMGTVKTFLNLDKNVRTCKCSDLILLSKINVQVKEVLPLLGELASSIAGIIPDTLMLTACIGKVIRFSDADWVANNKDLLLKFPTYHGDYEGGTYWMYDPDKALSPGVYPTCSNDLIYNKKHLLNNGIIATIPDSDPTRTAPISLFTPGGYFTLFVTASTNKDASGYISIEQTAYGRNVDAGKVYKRIIFIHDTEPYDFSNWYRIDNVDSINENYTRYGWSNAENYLDTLIYTGVCPYTQATIKVYVGNMDPDDVDSSVYKDGFISNTSNFTVFVNRSVDPDSSGYYHLTQQAYDRENHRIFYRLGWYKIKTINKYTDSNYTEFEDGPVFTSWQYHINKEDYTTLSNNIQNNFGICSTFSYATCSSSATDEYKVINIYSPVTKKSLKNGLYGGIQLTVRFENSNSVSNIKLKFTDDLEQLGSASVRYKGYAPTGAIPYWSDESVVTFVYNGSEWDIISMSEPFATDTVPGIVSTTTQTFGGNKTFSNDTSIKGTLTVGTISATKSTTLNGSLSVVGNIVQKGGNVVLDSNDKKTDGSYGATPRLIFRRGETTDSYNDWDMWVNSEGNFFLRKGTSATAGMENTWKNIIVAKDSEVVFSNTVKATTFSGNASSATKLTNTSAIGSDVQPVYFTSGGVPSSCSYKLPVLYINTLLGISDAGEAITTSQFIEFLKTKKVFDTGYAVYRGTWNYKSNHVITDTGCGNIHLAGATVEVIGVTTAYTIRIQTATTEANNAAGVKGEASRTFIYCYNGTDYSPGWYKLAKKGESLTASYSSGVLTIKV